MKKKSKLFIFILIISVLIAAGLGYAYITRPQLTLSVSENVGQESADNLSNPYMGWYQIAEYALSDSQTFAFDELHETALSMYNDRSLRLTLVEIYLEDYNTGEISDIGLNQLDGILSAYEDTGLSVILRFRYDHTDSAKNSEPKDISIIETHMEQVGNVINDHKDLVYLIQGLFIGSYGEMHGSNYLDDSSDPDTSRIRELAQVLSDSTNSSIFLSVRTPWQYRSILETFDPLSSENAYDGSLASRLGLYDDGLLGSDTDLGTYGTASLTDSTSYTAKATREEELSFQNELCLYVPNGGEVVIESELNDIENAVSTLRTMHLSYLDIDYDTEVLNKWKNSTYEDTTGFNYITNHMGYRYVLSKITVDTADFPSSEATFNFSITNTGFAPCYRPLTAYVNLVKISDVNGNSIVSSDDSVVATTSDDSVVATTSDTEYTLGNAASIIADTDARLYLPGETSTFSVTVDYDELEKGATYELILIYEDPATGEAISLANTGAGDQFVVGTFTLE